MESLDVFSKLPIQLLEYAFIVSYHNLLHIKSQQWEVLHFLTIEQCC